MQFTDVWWEQHLTEGFRVFVQYKYPDEEFRWTQTNMFHAEFELAYCELLQVLQDGIVDADDGRQLLVISVVIVAWPIA